MEGNMGKKFLYQGPVRRSAFTEDDFPEDSRSSSTMKDATNDVLGNMWDIPHTRTKENHVTNQSSTYLPKVRGHSKETYGKGYYSRHNVGIAPGSTSDNTTGTETKFSRNTDGSHQNSEHTWNNRTNTTDYTWGSKQSEPWTFDDRRLIKQPRQTKWSISKHDDNNSSEFDF